MQTVNISLTGDQVTRVDSFVNQLGYANRSEFFRSILRLIFKKAELLTEADSFEFQPPKTKNVGEIVTAFRKTNKYSPEFIADLEDGLRKSTYFDSKK